MTYKSEVFNLINNQSNGNAVNSIAQDSTHMSHKRSAAELDLDGSPTSLQNPKKIAESYKQPLPNEFFPKPLRLSGSLPNLELPNASEKTFIAHQSLSFEASVNKELQNTMTNDNSNNKTKTQYTIPTKNAFELLNSDANVKNNNSKQLEKQKNKIPPITVVGATNFTSALQILNKLIPNIDYTVKYMSIGTKILLKSIKVFNDFKKALNDSKIEFFTHDVQSIKFDRFILSGISKIPTEEITEALKTYQLVPMEIREFNPKTKKFDDEGSYIVSFSHGTTKIQNLNKTIINYTVPKWRLYLKSLNNITQCRRCQLYGHGMRNCNLNFKCSNCGLDHNSDNCTSPVTKCANCKGDHVSTAPDCPKRKEFMEMRSRLASNNNNRKTSKPTPAPRMNLKNFPEMSNLSSKITSSAVSRSAPAAPPSSQAKTSTWSSVLRNNTSTYQSAHNKFQINEIGPIMNEILSGLSRCQNREQQLVLMFEMATKYIYNVEP